jgi:hypothetical protein
LVVLQMRQELPGRPQRVGTPTQLREADRQRFQWPRARRQQADGPGTTKPEPRRNLHERTTGG